MNWIFSLFVFAHCYFYSMLVFYSYLVIGPNGILMVLGAVRKDESESNS